MKVRFATLALLALAAAATVTAQTPAPDEAALAAAPRITMAEFKSLHAGGNVLVLDTRAAESFAQGHVPGALNLPIPKMLEPDQLARFKAETRPIVIYCA